MSTTTGAPLVVDLDKTLTPADTLMELAIRLIKQSPLFLLRAPIWLLHGRAYLKARMVADANLSVETLPYRETLLDYLRGEKEKGRRIILATGAHRSIAERVAAHLGLFDDVLATDANVNLKGKAKLQAIREAVGRDFVYAGDSRADLPIWREAKAVVLVGVPSGLAKYLRRNYLIEREFPRERIGFGLWLRALRVHQWSKNLLLLVPLLTAFSFLQQEKLASMFLAFLSFSLAASATYIANDLWDLESDRTHPVKRFRPFASAKIPIVAGLAVASAALVIALVLALSVSQDFCGMLLLYVVLTSAYSWTLKEYVLIDVLVLSLLYTLRILAGSVAIKIETSSWLLAFSVFIFFSMALVKRCAELVSLDRIGRQATRGRDYRVTDLAVLWPLGVGAALSAVVIFGLFISAPEIQERYATPQLLWIVAICLIYWLARLWIKTARGEMHDDPVVYAITNRGSRITVVAMIVTTLCAHFFRLNFDGSS